MKLIFIFLGFVLSTFLAQAQTTYYSIGSFSTPTTASNWRTNRDGTGTSPSATNIANIILVVQNGHTVTCTTSAMSVVKGSSRIRLETGGIFTTNQNNNVDIELQGGRWIQSGSYAQTDFYGSGVNTVESVFQLSTATNFRFVNHPVSVHLTGGTLSCGNNSMSIDGDLNIGSGVTLNGTANNNPTHTIGGSINVTGGTLDLATAGGAPTFNVTGSINRVSGTIQHSGSATVTLTFGSSAGTDTLGMSTGTFRANINCAASQTSVIDAGTITHSAGTFTTGNSSTILLGNSVFSGAANLTVGTSVILETANTNGFDNGAAGCLNYSGTVTMPASTTFRYVGAATQSTGLSGYASLTSVNSIQATLTGGGTQVNLDKNITVTGDLLVSTSKTLNYNGFTLTLTGTISVSGSLTDNASSVLVVNTGNAVALPTSLTSLSGGLTINGALTSVTLGSSGLTIGAAFTLTNGTFNISGKALTLNGNIALTAGTLTTSSTTDLTFGGSGTYTLGTVATPANLNNLTINRTGLNFTLSQNLTVAGSATITAGTLTYSSRTLTIQSGLSGAGTIADNATSSLSFGNPSTNTIPTGTTSLSGSISVAGASTSLTYGASSLTLTGTITFSAGSIDISGKTLNLNGPINFTGGNLQTNGSTTLSIAGSGTTTWTGVAFPAALGTLTLNRSGFGLTLGSNLTVNTALTINASNTLTYNGYDLIIKGTFTQSGTLTENATSTLEISTGGAFSMPSAITSLNGGLRVATTGTNLSIPGASITVGAGFTINAGTFTITGKTVTLNGAISLSGGTISGNATTTLNIGGSGSISGSSTSMTSLGTLSFNRSGQAWMMGSALTIATATTITAGSLNLNGNSLTLNGNISFGSGGLVSTNTSSNLTFSGTGTFSGTIGNIIVNNFTLNRSGNTLNQSGAMQIFGTYSIAAGTHDFSGSSNSMEFRGPSSALGTISAANSNISILGSGAFTLGFGTITLNKFRIARASYTFTSAGNMTISDSLKVELGTFAVAAGYSLTLNGPVNVSSTLSFTFNSGLIIGGSGAISGFTLPTELATYTLNRSSASLTQTSDLTITGAASFSNGTHNIDANSLTLQGAVTFGSGNLNSLSTSNITINTSGVITGSIPITEVNNLTFNRVSRTLTLGAGLTVSGTLSIPNGTLDFSNQSLTVNNTFSMSGGSLSSNSSSSLIIGGSGTLPTISSLSNLNNLTMNRASTTLNLASSVTIAGSLSLSSGTLTCDNLTLNGNWGITSGALSTDATKSLTIGGSGTLPSTWSNSSSINNLTLNRSGATLVTSNSITVLGTYSLTAGTHRFTGTTLQLDGPISLGTGGLFTGGSTGNLVINGSGTITGSLQVREVNNFSVLRASASFAMKGLNTFYSAFAFSGSTLDLSDVTLRFLGDISNSGTWTVNSTTSLLIDGSGVYSGFPTTFTAIDSFRVNRSSFTQSVGADFTVSGAFELNAGIIDLTTRAITLNGPVTYTGGTLITNSFSNITVGGSGTISGFPTFSNINSISINRSGETINLGSNLTVASGLTTTAGFINSGSNTITLASGASLSSESTTGRVLGTVQATRTVGTGSSTFGNTGFAIAAGAENIGNVTLVRKTGPGNAITSIGNESINAQFNISISGSQPTSGRVITLKWLSIDNNGKDFSTGYGDVWRRNDLVSPWQRIANNQAFTLLSGVYTIEAVTTHFSDFTVTDDASPLPIDLAFFKAERKGNNAVLSWQTRSELNNKGFRIEESLENKSYKPVGFVDGKGHSTGNLNYSFIKEQPSAAYYRIVQIDADGAETFFGPVYLAANSEMVEQYLYPNPAVDVAVVKGIDENSAVEILDAQGKTVLTTILPESGLLNVNSLPKGSFYCKFITPEGVVIKRLNK